MAHIVSCMLDADVDLDLGLKPYYISKTDAQQLQPFGRLAEKASSSTLSLPSLASTSSAATEKPHVWRMHQPERKYQLFPKDKQVGNAAAGKPSLDPEQAFALALGQNAGDKTDSKAQPGTALRLRMKEHNLNRRRKVSVPELGPMTTVQEVSMDSPTIPGRPPLHERSISAPGHSWRNQPSLLDLVAAVAAEDAAYAAANITTTEVRLPALTANRQPLSPKSLAPLVIPTLNTAGSLAPKLTITSQTSLSRLRSGSTPVEPSLRSARTDDSPKTRTPYTPLSASTTLTTPKSAAISAPGSMSTVPTPISAPLESRSSPEPWGKSGSTADLNATPRAELDVRPPVMGHRRNHSESASMMERGRPRKRGESREGGGTTLKRTESRRSKSAERRAFEFLPKGWKAGEAGAMLHPSETAALQRQALQQAARFEVLRKDDVDNLSKELRHLDERTEYLRRTYTSLRAGRRNLHSRICQYLRSPRTAKFSHDSMLKQEEALAELDASIDDWVTKLEQAENRRTRVRQKLLEHVAAAATLALHQAGLNGGVAGSSESLQQAMGVRQAVNISTPPRSPTKVMFGTHTPGHAHSHSQISSTSGSPSPSRIAAHVPSTILEQPLVEEAAAIESDVGGLDLSSGVSGDDALSKAQQPQEAADEYALRRANMESIRIYADSDVYALLADVENEISKMGAGVETAAAASSEDERRKLHRAHSHELLSGAGAAAPLVAPIRKKGSNGSLPSPTTAQAPPSPKVVAAPEEEVIILSKAVFRPDESVLDL